MLGKVKETIEKYDMLSKEDTVIVALSGGADSVSLLNVLLQLGYCVRALHVNHMLRGEEADRDENFVRALCAERNVPLDVFRENIAEKAKERKLGLEECGREIRYERLRETAQKHNAKIATAHTMSDNAETLLMRVARGCSVDGLTAIPPVRGNIIRPLIEVTRAQIEAYCEENSLSFVTDSTNLHDDYARNRIRHITIPSLETINPQFVRCAARLARQAQRDADFMEQCVADAAEKAKRKNGMDASVLAALHPAVLSRLTAAGFEDFSGGKTLESVHIATVEELIKSGCGTKELPFGYRAAVRHGIFTFEKVQTVLEEWSVTVSESTADLPDGRTLEIKRVPKEFFEEMQKNDKHLFQNAFDYGKIDFNILARSRRPGDKLRQAKRRVTKEIRRLMNEKGMTAEERSRTVILSVGEDVLWAEHFGTDERYMPDENTSVYGVIQID